MKEIVQALFCIWEYLIPLWVADRRLEKRRLPAFGRALWYLGYGLQILLLICQRGFFMYSRWYLLFEIGCLVIWLLCGYRVKWQAALAGAALYLETVYVLDMLLLIGLFFLQDDPDYFWWMQDTLTWSRLLIFGLARAAVSMAAVILLWAWPRREAPHDDWNFYFVIPILEHLCLMQCDDLLESGGSLKLGRILQGLYVFLIVFLAAIFWIVLTVMRRNRKYEQDILEMQIQSLKKEGERTRERILEQARQVHDMKHHWIAVRGLLQEGQTQEALEYAQQQLGLAYSERWYVNSGQPIIDAVLNDKIARAKQDGIRISWDVEPLTKPVMEDRDWCVVLGNQLDNALEASRKLTEQDRQMDIRLKKYPGGFRLTVANRADAKPEKKDGRLVSLKKGGAHGIGYESAKRTIEAYGGILTYQYERGMFVATADFFVSQKTFSGQLADKKGVFADRTEISEKI